MKKILILILIFLVLVSMFKKHNFQYKENSNEKVVHMIMNKTKDIVELPLEEYLKGVLYAEMPGSFNIESLKAQAVAARTYTLKKLATSNHICDNPAHCQAWNDPLKSEYYEKICQAVDETKNQKLTYLGEPIEAFFHSSSGGKTENSEDVWTSSKPYLISVDSPGEEKIMSSFYSTKKVMFSEIVEKINKHKNNKVITTNNLKNKIKILSRTDGNRVKELKIQNTILSGIEIRNIFELRSSNFTIELTDKSVIFKVAGYGHGVGMSQWGAEVMARNGSTYKEILYHYYPGTLLENTL